MKRFYQTAVARAAEGGFDIFLDDRPVRTPGKAPLRVPTAPLADAIVAEWNAQGDKVDPRAMPLTGLANAAIDRIGPDRDSFVRALAVYGETDLLCYRADTPALLAERQEENWDPLLAWARHRYDVDFEIAYGIIHKPQPESTVERLRKAVDARSAFELAALSPLVTIAGSLIVALALVEGEIGVDRAWSVATLDEDWQAQHWGVDEEAAERLAARRREFEAAYRFFTLLD